MEKKEYNYVLDLLRFIFCLLVVMTHSWGITMPTGFYPFWGGYIAVEFFFMVSGYFMMSKVDRLYEKKDEAGKISLRNVFSKYKKLFIYILIAVITLYVFRIYTKEITISKLYYAIFEILLLNPFGIGLNNYLMTPLWFLSFLIIWELVLMYIALKHKDLFSNVLVYIFTIFGYGFIAINIGHVNVWNKELIGPVLYGNIRAISGICLGCICYNLSNKLKNIKMNTLTKVILSLIEVLSFIVVIGLRYKNAQTYLDFICILLIFIGLVLLNSGHTLSYKVNKLRIRPFKFLGRISMPIYILHYPILCLLLEFLKGIDSRLMLKLYLLLSITIPMLIYVMVTITCWIYYKIAKKSKDKLEKS